MTILEKEAIHIRNNALRHKVLDVLIKLLEDLKQETSIPDKELNYCIHCGKKLK